MNAAAQFLTGSFQVFFEPYADLEWFYIEEYLQAQGHRLRELAPFSVEERKRLMTGACRYASMRLAEIELRARFIRKMHGEVSG